MDKVFSDVEGFFFKGFGEGRDIGLTQRSKRGKNNFLIVTSCLAYGVDFAGKLQWNLKFEKNKIPMCPLSSPCPAGKGCT